MKIASLPISMASPEPTTELQEGIKYQITDPAKRILAPFGAVTVYVDADGGGAGTPSAADPATYTLNRLTGAVTFNPALPADATVTIQGDYLSPTTVAESYEYSWTIEADNQDASAFQDSFVKRKQGLLDVSAELSRWYVDASLFDLLDTDKTFVVEFYSDSNTAPLRAWMKIASNEISSAIDSLVEEALELEGTPDSDRRVVSRV
ncbi:hypothetical protein EDC32_10810 [Laceyella sacchari]|uniref:hypothetical protein n=1 Tax=Laceyella sacchari TaxID=37482 RepID=UPI000A987DBC|nr:hypothetical protein [Laceyella sacchari]TCW35298.1 hypothetical protein EDC32_10810 [Laceyella sacchari]